MIIFKPHKTIETVQQFLPEDPVIVEAGAFDGNDTVKMATKWPRATIHAFEPLPEIYDRLRKNTAKFSHIFYYPCALSNQNGTALFYVSERSTRPGVASQAGSLHEPKNIEQQSFLIFPRTATVSTITLDQWAQENGVRKIDLLWLDTQGHELAILQAAKIMIKHIAVVLTEVSFVERYQGQPRYEEIVAWMLDQGFDLVGADFSDTTTAVFGNLLFVKK